MAKKSKQVLGRGLSALLNDPDNDIRSAKDTNADKVVGNIIELELDKIQVNPFQPRTSFNEEALDQLASSIKELGIIQPITVRKLDFNEFQLVSGERRFRAAKFLGLASIPAYVRLANDQESLEMALVENIQRQDLDPIEIGLSYQRLLEEIQLTQEQLSDRVGKKRSTISNYIRLLKLDPLVQGGMRDGFLSMGHGRALINVDSQKLQVELYEKIIEESLSVRATETLVKNLKNPPPVDSTPSSKKDNMPPDPYVTATVKDLEGVLKTNVSLSSNAAGKGSLKISFNSQEKLEKILKIIKGVS